ncbi:hypothetical protein WM29_16615 [Burkholderia ubonensis]|nr:hypothetical protein WM29_16615 [Burkholderia ubonensis]
MLLDPRAESGDFPFVGPLIAADHVIGELRGPRQIEGLNQATRSDLVLCIDIPDEGDTLSGYRRLHEQRIIVEARAAQGPRVIDAMGLEPKRPVGAIGILQ